MEINKEHLEKKLAEFTAMRNQAQEQIEKWDLIFKKHAGAVETIQILLSELNPKPEIKPELKKK